MRSDRPLPTAPPAAPAARSAAAESAGRLERLPPGLVMALLTILGLALRLVWFNRYQLAGTDCDGAGYMDVARHIASGAGFTTNVYKYLYLPPASLPQPDAHWNPLYPLLTAGAFRLFGESMFSAKLVPLLLGTAVPALVYRLAQALTGDRRTALAAGLLAVAHPVLVTWSLRIETEIGTLALVTAVLVLMFRPKWQGSVALGVVAGLAWWMKYQSALLWGAILLQAAIMRPPRRGLRGLAIVALAFTVTISPWLARNQRVFGDPFHTDLRTDVISDYAGLGGRNRVWASLTPPPKPIPYLLAHGSEALHHVYGNLVGFARDLPREASGSVLLVPLALVGVLAEARRWRNWAPPVFYGALLLALFSISTAHTRYLYSVIPIVIVLSASGAVWLAGRAAVLPRAPAAALRVLLVLGVGVAIADEVRTAAAAATDRRSVWTPANELLRARAPGGRLVRPRAHRAAGRGDVGRALPRRLPVRSPGGEPPVRRALDPAAGREVRHPLPGRRRPRPRRAPARLVAGAAVLGTRRRPLDARGDRPRVRRRGLPAPVTGHGLRARPAASRRGTRMYRDRKVVVVMPAYNASKTLLRTHEEIMAQGVVDLVVVVDDASGDDTVALARGLPNTLVHVHERNLGYGGNQKTCYRLAIESGADIVIMVHPDYQYTPRLVPAMAAMIGQDLYSCVLGSRILGGYAVKGGMPYWKYFANRVLTLVENILVGAKLSEYHTGYRAFSRELLLQLPLEANSDDFVFDNQMLLEILWLGHTIAEVSCPTKYFKEASSIDFRRSVTYGLGCLHTAVTYWLARRGWLESRLFPREGRAPR